MKTKLLLSVVTIILTLSCQTNTKNSTDKTIKHEKAHELKHNNNDHHWSYEGENGPEHWIEIEKQSDCNGKYQSPINIIDIDVVDSAYSKSLKIYYSENVKIHDIKNNGHSIQYNFEKGDYITLNDKKFELKQFHFHEESEHTINGIRYPLEMHLVHVSDDNEIAVLSIMAIEGVNSEPFTFLENFLPIKKGETKEVNMDFNLNLNLPKNKEYYTYNGSLTTPPCTEGVNWFIFKTPITVSVEQVKLLKELMPNNNYRNTQALNSRKVNQGIIK